MKTKRFLCAAISLLIGHSSATQLQAQSSEPSSSQPRKPSPYERILKIDVITSKPRKIAGGDFDDRMQRVSMRVKFTNLDTKLNIEKLRATILVFGESIVEHGTIKVLTREDAAVDVPIRQTIEHQTKEIATAYDKDGARFGFPYSGWAIVVKDAAGAIVAFKSTSPSMDKARDKVAGFTAESCYNRKLETTPDPDRR